MIRIYAATNNGLGISTDSGSTFINKTMANGLGSNVVNGVYASADGSRIYAATSGGGLGISTDSGTSFTTKTTANSGVGSDTMFGVYASADGARIYAATNNGLSYSIDSGANFTNKTTANGLGNDVVIGVYASADGTRIYAATYGGGLSYSIDSGANFTTKTTANGLGSNVVNGVYASADGSRIYAATYGGGLSYSIDSGASFTTKTTVNSGLGGNFVPGVYASADGSRIYAATNGGLSISTDSGATFTNKTTADGLGNNVVYRVYASEDLPTSNICFPADTPILTDQGIIAIDQINPDIHTINKKPIVDIIKTITLDKFLVGFKKNALGFNYPTKNTLMSQNHKVYYQGKMRKAKTFLGHFEKAGKVKYTGEILYNVLMEKHSKIQVNNLICETLHPENIIAKLYTKKSNYSDEERDKIVVLLKNCIKKKDYESYNRIVGRR